MTDLLISRTEKSPTITAKSSGYILLDGISIPENVKEFYQPLKDWLNEYLKNPAKVTTIEVKLDYFNTSTSVVLLGLFKTISNLKGDENSLVINWYYEVDDLEIRDSGIDFSNFLGMKINVIEFER